MKKCEKQILEKTAVTGKTPETLQRNSKEMLKKFDENLQPILEKNYKEKNLWHRKCVRKAIFRNVEVRVEGG